MTRFFLPLISKVRRNHALEHATLHVLSRQMPNLSVVGRSDWRGYSIYGQVDTGQLARAAQEALARLKAGEGQLAIHPRCGTTLATTGILSGLAAFLALGLGDSKGRFRWANLPEALLAATIGAIVAQPLGMWLQQRITTSGSVGDLHITRVFQQRGGSVPIHRVETV
jgi:hypothetical protein